MWISKQDYLKLVERIEKLEQSQEVVYGRYVGGLTLLSRSWMESHSYGIAGKRVSVRELLCKMANHLGFYYEDTQPGYLAAPRAEVKAKTGK